MFCRLLLQTTTKLFQFRICGFLFFAFPCQFLIRFQFPLFPCFYNFLKSFELMHASGQRLLSCSQIPDFSKDTHKLFIALDKRGDFKIWHDEFESLCDVVADEIDRQRRKLRVTRSRSGDLLHVISENLRIVPDPVYDHLIWALTLASVVVAICESEVCCCDLPLTTYLNILQFCSCFTWQHKYWLFRSFKKHCVLMVWRVSMFQVTSEYIKNKLAIPEIVLGM